MVALFVASHAMAVWSMFHTCEVWWSSSRTPAVRGWTPDATHFMFIDADIGFATGQIAAMLGFDEDFISAVFPLKAYLNSPAVAGKSRCRMHGGGLGATGNIVTEASLQRRSMNEGVSRH
jgi:hypothetical protein